MNTSGFFCYDKEKGKRSDWHMAKSKTKKMREHLKRNGMRDAVLSRGTAPSFSTHERVTKTKKDRLERIKHKKRNPYDHRSDDGGSFFMPESRVFL